MKYNKFSSYVTLIRHKILDNSPFIICAHCDKRYSAVAYCISIRSLRFWFNKLKKFYYFIYFLNFFKVIVLHLHL